MLIKQFRYYNKEAYAPLNQPKNLTADQLISGEIFNNITCSEIRIKTLPGVVLTINNIKIMIGDAGEYDLLLREKVLVTDISISEESINMLINNNEKAYFIITFIQKES